MNLIKLNIKQGILKYLKTLFWTGKINFFGCFNEKKSYNIMMDHKMTGTTIESQKLR